MSASIEIIAITNFEQGYPDADIYYANSEEEAEKFCELWDEKEAERAESWGGWPGQAFTTALPLPAAEWIQKRQAELQTVSPEGMN